MEQSHSGFGEGQGRVFVAVGDGLSLESHLHRAGAWSRGWGVGRPGTGYIMQNRANPSKCQTARNYLLGEGDLIGIRASAEAGKEGVSK